MSNFLPIKANVKKNSCTILKADKQTQCEIPLRDIPTFLIYIYIPLKNSFNKIRSVPYV